MDKTLLSHKFQCKSCGGDMTFDVEAGALKCEYCGTTSEIEKVFVEAEEYSINSLEDLATHEWGSEKRVVVCESCSGQTLIDLTEVTTECVFCGSNRVVTEELDQGIKPETMLPFGVTRELAKNNIHKYIKGKFYAPNVLRSKQNLERLKSLYIPHFTYDSDTSSFYTAKRGDHYYVTKTRRVNGKTETYQERKTRWRNVSGEYGHYYDDVLINASSKVDDHLISRIKSFDLNVLEKYNEAYLVGHHTERYQVSVKDGWYKAKNIVDDQIHEGIRRQVGGDEFRMVSCHTDYGDIKFKHLLLPIWITSYPFKDKIYNVYINGQNGHVYGEYPKSVIKILLTILGLAALVFIIYMFIVAGGQ